MTEPTMYVTLALSGVTGVSVVAAATLAGWRGWLELKRSELDRAVAPGAPSAGARIEIADLKERIRKLEALAAGVEL